MDNVKLTLEQLVDKRQTMEEEIETLSFQLKPYIDKNLHKNLIDDEGFPRADLDFGQIQDYRNLKRRQNELLNDYKDLMKEIEQGLINYHQEKKNDQKVIAEMEEYDKKKAEERQKSIDQAKQEVNKEEFKNENILLPFAIITEVTSGSPSYESGIQKDDLIVKFGDVTIKNNQNLQKLTENVKNNIDQQINVEILRRAPPGEQEENIFEFNNKNYIQGLCELSEFHC